MDNALLPLVARRKYISTEQGETARRKTKRWRSEVSKSWGTLLPPFTSMNGPRKKSETFPS